MKHLFRLLLVTSLLVTVPAALPHAAVPAAAAGDDTVQLGGVTVRLRAHTTQVVTVNHTRGWHARVVLWTREDGRWERRFRTRHGAIGYGGLVRPRHRVQGSGKTPLGSFRLPWAFGRHRQRDAWDPSYRKVRRGDYWVLDNRSDHYNRFRNKSRGGFRWWLGPDDPNASERLQDYPKQYEYSFVTSFNGRQVRHRGGAIFLHVNGSGATAGCVSAPRWFLRRLMVRLDQDRAPVVAIGR